MEAGSLMTWGTSHFVSLSAAIIYYHPYEPGATSAQVRATVERKISEGSIHIGKPVLRPSETLLIIDDGTRYAITSKEVPQT